MSQPRGHRRQGSAYGGHWCKHKKNADGGSRLAHKRHRRSLEKEIKEHMEGETDERAVEPC